MLEEIKKKIDENIGRLNSCEGFLLNARNQHNPDAKAELERANQFLSLAIAQLEELSKGLQTTKV